MRSLLSRFLDTFPLGARLIVLLGAAELLAALVLPAIIPRGWYLAAYLPPGAESSMEEFLAGDHVLLPDAHAGWRSAPLQRNGLWRTDERGARSTGRLDWDGDAALRILALGSSMMNGGTSVSNEETITAYLEDENTTTLNFASMLYGTDQAFLRFQGELRELGADVVLVGLDADPYGALKNVFVPLRRPEEANMPFVKPRFVLEGDSLTLIEADPHELLRPDGMARLLALAEERDGYFIRFRGFVRLGQTPGLASFRWGAERAALRLPDPEQESLDATLEGLMRRFERSVHESGGRLVFLAMPPDQDGFAAALPTHEARVARWRELGFSVVDGGRALQESGLPLAELYWDDGIHFTPAGNELLANAIRTALESGG